MCKVLSGGRKGDKYLLNQIALLALLISMDAGRWNLGSVSVLVSCHGSGVDGMTSTVGPAACSDLGTSQPSQSEGCHTSSLKDLCFFSLKAQGLGAFRDLPRSCALGHRLTCVLWSTMELQSSECPLSGFSYREPLLLSPLLRD